MSEDQNEHQAELFDDPEQLDRWIRILNALDALGRLALKWFIAVKQVDGNPNDGELREFVVQQRAQKILSRLLDPNDPATDARELIGRSR